MAKLLSVDKTLEYNVSVDGSHIETVEVLGLCPTYVAPYATEESEDAERRVQGDWRGDFAGMWRRGGGFGGVVVVGEVGVSGVSVLS